MYFHISRRFWNFQSLCTAWCKHHWNTHISLTCSDLHITAPQLPDVRGKLFTLSGRLQFSFISKSVRFPFKQLCRWTVSNKDRSLSQISKSPGLHFFSNQIFSYWKQRYKLCVTRPLGHETGQSWVVPCSQHPAEFPLAMCRLPKQSGSGIPSLLLQAERGCQSENGTNHSRFGLQQVVTCLHTQAHRDKENSEIFHAATSENCGTNARRYLPVQQVWKTLRIQVHTHWATSCNILPVQAFRQQLCYSAWY